MGKKIHSPFLYHLFVCCGENYKIFVSDINNQIENRIEESYNEVIEGVSQRKIVDGGIRTIKTGFYEFVEKMENRKEGKAPQYCLFGFYIQIATLSNYLLPNKRDVMSQSDREILNRFRSVYDYFHENNAGEINDKRIRDLFKRIKDRKALNDTQDKLFYFILKECFPYYYDEQEGLLEKIRSKPWERVAFGDRGYIDISESVFAKDNILELKQLFEKFNKMAMDDSYDIRDNLERIARLLDDIYQSENDFYDREVLNEKSEKQVECVSAEEGRDSELHSHILAFMHWVPMMSENEINENIMESVDNIIRKIEEKVYETIKDNNSLKQSLVTYPEDYRDTIFIQAESVDLRRLLIEAMCHEPYIYSHFHCFYRMADNQTKI